MSEGQCTADVHLEREDLRAVCHHLRRHEVGCCKESRAFSGLSDMVDMT